MIQMEVVVVHLALNPVEYKGEQWSCLKDEEKQANLIS